jgi:hypothetical protein
MKPSLDQAEPSMPRALVALGLLIYVLLGVLTALYEVMLVPLRIGATIAPITIALAVASNWVLPRLSRRISPDNVGAMAPVIGWVVAIFVLALGRPEGDVLLAGGSGDDAKVGYALMIAGFITGIGTVLRLGSVALAQERQSRRNIAPSRR